MDKRQKRQPFKIDRTLDPEHRVEYEALLADPRTTGMEAHAWLAARGYHIGKGAVFHHRRFFRDQLADVRQWAGVAQHLSAAARVQGRGVLAEGTLTQFEHMLMRTMHTMQQAGTTLDTKQFAELATAVSKAVASREAVDELRRSYDERAERAVAEAERVAKEGKYDGVAVVERVRQILGV